MVVPSRNPSSFPSFSDVPSTSVRRRDPRFIGQTDVDGWIRDRRVTVEGPIMTLLSSGDRFVLSDAVRVLGPRGEVDVFGMTGRVMAVAELLNMGASLTSTSARVGMTEYEVQLGFTVQRIPERRLTPEC